MKDSKFFGRRVSFLASYYIRRMRKYSGASPSCFTVALIYLQRFKPLKLTSTTVQRLLLVAVMTATKFLEDAHVANSEWYSPVHKISGDSIRNRVRLRRALDVFLHGCARFTIMLLSLPQEFA